MTCSSPSTRTLIKAVLASAAVALTGLAQAQAVFKITAIPDESPTELARKAAPLVKYLEHKLGTKVEFTPVSDYAAAVEALASTALMRMRVEGDEQVMRGSKKWGRWANRPTGWGRSVIVAGLAVPAPHPTKHLRCSVHALRGANMMTPMPASASAAPAMSHGVGRTPSTAHSQTMATKIYTPP